MWPPSPGPADPAERRRRRAGARGRPPRRRRSPRPRGWPSAVDPAWYLCTVRPRFVTRNEPLPREGGGPATSTLGIVPFVIVVLLVLLLLWAGGVLLATDLSVPGIDPRPYRGVVAV